MFKKILNILTTVLMVSLIVLLVAMFIARASGNSLSIFGFRLYRVATDSMEPTLMVGDVILVRQADGDEIHKDDIISYKAEEGVMKGNIITHRVILEPEEQDGKWLIQTQGDREGATLDPQITDDQVVGKYVRTMPIISKIYSFFLKPYGLITLIVIILVLFGYEMISLIVSYRSLDKTYDKYSAVQTDQQDIAAADADDDNRIEEVPVHEDHCESPDENPKSE